MHSFFKGLFRFLLPVFVVFVLLAEPAAPTGPQYLRVESRIAPMGIDVLAPRFSWSSPPGSGIQRAYQVRAASSTGLLARNLPDLWDSGNVVSAQTSGIAYAGTALHSRDRVFWQVRT